MLLKFRFDTWNVVCDDYWIQICSFTYYLRPTRRYYWSASLWYEQRRSRRRASFINPLQRFEDHYSKQTLTPQKVKNLNRRDTANREPPCKSQPTRFRWSLNRQLSSKGQVQSINWRTETTSVDIGLTTPNTTAPPRNCHHHNSNNVDFPTEFPESNFRQPDLQTQPTTRPTNAAETTSPSRSCDPVHPRESRFHFDEIAKKL